MGRGVATRSRVCIDTLGAWCRGVPSRISRLFLGGRVTVKRVATTTRVLISECRQLPEQKTLQSRLFLHLCSHPHACDGMDSSFNPLVSHASDWRIVPRKHETSENGAEKVLELIRQAFTLIHSRERQSDGTREIGCKNVRLQSSLQADRTENLYY